MKYYFTLNEYIVIIFANLINNIRLMNIHQTELILANRNIILFKPNRINQLLDP